MISSYAFVVAGLLPAYAAIAYYLLFVVLRALGVREWRPPRANPRRRWTIVIPAHNEATTLASTLRSCQQLDYPASLCHLVVIADNCQDATASIAREHGATCLERLDPSRRGKGQALAWALPQVLADQPDVLLILDADCTIDRQALRVAETFLEERLSALQLNHRVVNADASAISYVAAVGRTLEYDLFFAPKSHCGLSVLLVGTGMIFSRALLERIPWDEHGFAEDTEYTLRLAKEGERVRFIANAHVGTRAVESLEALRIQRQRWAAGNVGIGRSTGLRWLLIGSILGRFRQAELGWTLLLLSRPLVLAHMMLVVASGLALGRLGNIAPSMAHAAWPLLGLHGMYLLSGIVATGVSLRRVVLLGRAPIVLWQLITIAARSLIGRASGAWERTPRP